MSQSTSARTADFSGYESAQSAYLSTVVFPSDANSENLALSTQNPALYSSLSSFFAETIPATVTSIPSIYSALPPALGEFYESIWTYENQLASQYDILQTSTTTPISTTPTYTPTTSPTPISTPTPTTSPSNGGSGSAPTSSPASSSGGLSDSAKLGIGLGVGLGIPFIAGLIVLIIFIMRKRNRHNNYVHNEPGVAVEPYEHHASPQMGYASPQMGHTSPHMGQTSPHMGQTSPHMGQTSPQTSPGFNQSYQQNTFEKHA